MHSLSLHVFFPLLLFLQGHWRGEQRHCCGDENRQGQRRGRSPQQETVHRTGEKLDADIEETDAAFTQRENVFVLD